MHCTKTLMHSCMALRACTLGLRSARRTANSSMIACLQPRSMPLSLIHRNPSLTNYPPVPSLRQAATGKRIALRLAQPSLRPSGGQLRTQFALVQCAGRKQDRRDTHVQLPTPKNIWLPSVRASLSAC